MAARLAPDNVRRMHQSLHHLVADAPWSDEAMLERVRGYALSAMCKQEPVAAWIVDDTGFPKKGKESVGVAHQYCGQLGKQENCRVAVSLSVSTGTLSLPVAYRLYLPESSAKDGPRGKRRAFPKRFSFKPNRGLRSIRFAKQWSGMFLVEWYWQTPPMAWTVSFAPDCERFSWNMPWASNRRLASGSRGNNPCRPSCGKRKEDRRSCCNGMRSIARSAPSS